MSTSTDRAARGGVCMNGSGRDEQMRNIGNMSRRRRGLPKLKRLQQSAPVFAALGDERRLGLIAVLYMGGAMSISQLTSGTHITRQAITKHLNVLAAAGLVRDLKVGRERMWAFEPAQLDDALRSLEAIVQQWDHALARLKAVVES
jgi:DNA-binding transcriptional ArsR family regulator